MVSVEQLSQVPFFQGLPAWAIREFATGALEKTLDHNEFIVRQHDEADSVFFLLSGSAQFLIRYDGKHDLLVATTRDFGALIGWSVLRIPHRYTATVRCEERCRVLKIPAETFEAVMEKDPRLGYLFLKRTAATLATRLEKARDLLTTGSREPDCVV